jgi:alanine dehydrogenase
MKKIGIITELKSPPDNRVALTPDQCNWVRKLYPDLQILVQRSPHRCFSDDEYLSAGIEIGDNMENATYY